MPRGAGIAIAIGALVPVVASGSIAGPVVISLAGFAVLGAWDDLRSLVPAIKLPIQLALGLVLGLELIDSTWTWALAVLGAIFVTAVANATNFMDGVDGITDVHAIVWGTFFLYQFDWVAPNAGRVLAGAFLGAALAFLPWTLPNARAFLGDSGSYFFGAAVAVLAIYGVHAGMGVAAVAPLAIYATDTSWTLAMRFAHREPLLLAHHGHCYQRLASSGWSHRRVAGFTGFLSAVCAVLGLVASPTGSPARVPALLLMGLVCVSYVTLTGLVERRAVGRQR
jgi:UDP-N-acetylmuramyl pentapeptide phosphotransferase/UDP-N-acetylglucosamine-1-phosphate transferase